MHDSYLIYLQLTKIARSFCKLEAFLEGWGQMASSSLLPVARSWCGSWNVKAKEGQMKSELNEVRRSFLSQNHWKSFAADSEKRNTLVTAQLLLTKRHLTGWPSIIKKEKNHWKWGNNTFTSHIFMWNKFFHGHGIFKKDFFSRKIFGFFSQ